LRFRSQKNRGKGLILFPLFLFLLSSGIQAQWRELFTNLANFGNNKAVDLEALNSARGTLHFHYHFEDIYRKYLQDSRTFAVQQDHCSIQIRIPLQGTYRRHLLETSTSLAYLSADNHHDRASVTGELSGTGFSQNVRWTTSNGKYLFGFRGEFRESTGAIDLNIHEYPDSENPRLNKYFLDWLPLTFGDSINTDTRSELIDIGVWYSFPLTRNSRLRLLASKSVSNNLATFNYLNTTNKDTLNGWRQLDVPADVNRNHAEIRLTSPRPGFSSITLRYLGANTAFDSDNHPPPSADFESLGDGSIEYHNLALSSEYTVHQQRWTAGISLAGYHGNYRLQTPVLGYTTLLFIPLPIAHKASGRIRQGQIFSQNISYSTEFQTKHFNAHFTIDYLHSRYKLHTTGEAQLEFGLQSTPIDYPIKIDANIFDIDLQCRKNFKYITICYSFSQLFPIIRRIDDSPIKFTERVPERKIRERGGQAHQLSIEYYF
jgi:hypothetical protein